MKINLFGLNLNIEIGSEKKINRFLNDQRFLQDLPFIGKHKVEHYRFGKLFDIYDINNGITNEGKNRILDTMFFGASQIAAASWYKGLIDLTSFSTLAAGDTMSSHAGWIELTSYTEATRPGWGPGAASGQATTNATPTTFSINATCTCKGIFVVSNNTKGGTTGVLWATGTFSGGDVALVSGDQLKTTYTVST